MITAILIFTAILTSTAISATTPTPTPPSEQLEDGVSTPQENSTEPTISVTEEVPAPAAPAISPLINLANQHATIQKMIDDMIKTYPATYTVHKAPLGIIEVTAINPDTNSSVEGITAIILHKGFRASEAFQKPAFHPTRAVQWRTSIAEPPVNGYISAISEIKSAKKTFWKATLTQLTTQNPTAPSFPTPVKPEMPSRKKLKHCPVVRKTDEQIRKELEQQFFS